MKACFVRYLRATVSFPLGNDEQGHRAMQQPSARIEISGWGMIAGVLFALITACGKEPT